MGFLRNEKSLPDVLSVFVVLKTGDASHSEALSDFNCEEVAAVDAHSGKSLTPTIVDAKLEELRCDAKSLVFRVNAHDVNVERVGNVKLVTVIGLFFNER